MAVRRREEQEFQETKAQLGPQLVTLAALTGGYNGWVTPDILSPQFWAQTSNLYSGQFATIRRARWAPVLNSSSSPGGGTPYAPSGLRITSMFTYFPNGANFPYIVIDDGNNAYTGASFLPGTIFLQFGATGTGTVIYPLPFIGNLTQANMLGPWMRIVPIPSFIIQTNGIIRSKFFLPGPNLTPQLEYWGIDAPDASPQITLSAGATATISAAPTGATRLSNIATIQVTAPLAAGFVAGAYVQISGVTDTTFNTATGVSVQIKQILSTTSFTYANVGANVPGGSGSGSGTVTLGITKTVGRSYQFAWENNQTVHKSAPSPASQFVKYTSQIGTIDCIQPGTIAAPGGTSNITGSATQFSQAWVGRKLWINGIASAGGGIGYIQSVVDATHLTVTGTTPAIVNQQFQVYDQGQGLFVDLYATGDGGSVYFLIGRNQFSPFNNVLATSGLEFTDAANSEPPNAPFTGEIAQNFNIPPPIGQFLDQYQGRPIVYGVPAALQSFFYGNMETTVVGQPSESFAPLNQVTLPIGEGQLNGSANLPTGFILWSNHQDMFKLTGLLSDNTVSNQFQLGATIQRLPYRIGCASPYATAITSLGVFWLSSDRQVWLFTDHYAPKNVGTPIQDILNRINGARLGFAKMKIYKANDRNWLALAIALDSSGFNNKLCLLDLDLLASNGQPSFFTFDMASNAPTWYLYDVNCESIESAIDGLSKNHMLVGDVNLVTDVDWQPGYFTVGAEQNVTGSNTLHAIGNDNPEVIKTMDWMRAMTNQLPKNLAAQGWKWNILTFDDDTSIIGVTTTGNVVQLIPGQNNPSGVLGLEYSPAKFLFGSKPFVKGRRFQIQTIFPSAPGFYELRGFQVAYQNVVAR